jgi:ParB family chromosome partitioning protein
MTSEGGIETALSKLSAAPTKKPRGLLGDIEQLSEAVQRYPWTSLAELRGDPQILKKLEETEKLLKELRRALTK